MIQTKATLTSKTLLVSGVYHLTFSVEGEGMPFIPGQYIILTIPSSPTPLKRLYSFAGSNQNKNVFELLVKMVPNGIASSYIQTLTLGSVVDIAGPAGLFREQNTPLRKIYMVTNTGVAPIRSFLRSRPSSTVNSSLYWGFRDFSETYLIDELLELKKSSPSFSFHYCLSQQKSFDLIPADLQHYFRMGHIDAVWQAQNPIVGPLDEYYLCGSREIIESLRLHLLERGIAKEKIFFEKY